jgi:hypothetical protein
MEARLEETTPVHVVLLDYDDCLAHERVIAELTGTGLASKASLTEADRALVADTVIKHNPLLLDLIRRQPASVRIVAVGSNRQSKGINDANSFKRGQYTGSAFDVTPKIAEALHAEFCPALLADIRHNQTIGTAFNKATNPSTPDTEQLSAWLENSKLLIVFMHAHQTALSHPTQPIVIDFFDDRTLGAASMLAECQHWLPETVTVRFWQYKEGAQPKQTSEVRGSGIVYPDYAAKIKSMVEICSTEIEEGNYNLRLDTDLLAPVIPTPVAAGGVSLAPPFMPVSPASPLLSGKQARGSATTVVGEVAPVLKADTATPAFAGQKRLRTPATVDVDESESTAAGSRLSALSAYRSALLHPVVYSHSESLKKPSAVSLSFTAPPMGDMALPLFSMPMPLRGMPMFNTASLFGDNAAGLFGDRGAFESPTHPRVVRATGDVGTKVSP